MSNAPSGRLTGKVVVITGSGQGIGRAYAHRVAAEGATVIVADLNDEKGAKVAAEIGAEGGQATFRHLDVADPDSVSGFAEAVITEHPAVHGLVNNAAIFSTLQMRQFWEIPVAEWDRLMAVNIRGPWLLTTALLPALRAADTASVINIGSDSVWMGRPGYLHYATSKAGISGMSNSMARELGGDDIRVNTVSPGAVYTEVERATVSAEQKAAMLAAQALHRPATPDDLVGTVVFLLSDDSAYITGQSLSVNGGLLHR